MIAYFGLVAYVAALGFVFSSLRKGRMERILYLVLALSALYLMMSLRAPSVGIDTEAYEGYFMRIGTNPDYMNIVNSAPLYSVANRILYMLWPDPQALLFFSAAVVCGGVGFFIYHCSQNIFLSTFFYITLYFFCNAMNGTRQAMAMSLCLVALTIAAKYRKVALVVLFSVLAVGVHNTSIIFVPFAFLPFLKITPRRLTRISVAVVSAAAILFVGLRPLVEFVSLNFPNYYSQYVDILFGEAFATSGRNIIQTAFLAALLYLYYQKCVKEKNNKLATSLFIPALFGIAMSAAFFQNYLLGARIPLYFVVLFVAIIPNLIGSLGRNRFLLEVGTIGVSLVLFFILLYGNYAGVVPYEMVI